MIKKISLITRSRCRSDRPPFQKTKEETLPPLFLSPQSPGN
jgi:hypothetical protein